MFGDITLTQESRNALLSLQATSALMARTQARLTSGLKVASPLDDAVAYYKAQNLSDRAADFTDRKNEIDQGISSVKAAIVGTSLADRLLRQMKGLVNSARTADLHTRAALTSQFNDLAKQLNSGMADTQYQGLNLLANSTAALTVYFDEGTRASLRVQAQNLATSVLLTAASAASSGALSVMLSGGSAATDASGFSVLSDSTSSAAVLDNLSAQLDASISTVRATAARLGGSVTMLQTRLDFTTNYVDTLNEGAGKMTLADLNEEAANLLALQTRYQIGISMMSIAAQHQQAILSLFH